ncbi:TPA: Lymphocyte transmembrane adapter 1 [Trebouxia sp. C0006]
MDNECWWLQVGEAAACPQQVPLAEDTIETSCWTPQARASCTLLPPNFMRKWDWAPIFVLNLFIVLWFLVNGVGFGIAYSTIQIVDDVKTFHVFAECYQCPAKSALSGSG